MKLLPVTKLESRNKKASMKLTSCQKIMTSLSFFQLMVNLELSGSQIPDVQFVKLTFSLIVSFYLTKICRTKKSLTQLSHYSFVKGTIFAKNADFLQKNVDISKIKRVFVPKGIFSETKYECILTNQFLSL